MLESLIDASYLVALGYPRDRYHSVAKQFAAQNNAGQFIPDVVLVEVIYNLQRLGGTVAAARFAELLLSQSPQCTPLAPADFARAMVIMQQYREADLDFVDCCLTALAERLNISRICTFDRRDFSIIRPKHVEYFELLP